MLLRLHPRRTLLEKLAGAYVIFSKNTGKKKFPHPGEVREAKSHPLKDSEAGSSPCRSLAGSCLTAC